MKAHLKDSETALREGESYEALCGVEVPNVAFVYVFDTGFVPEFLGSLSAINTCSKCYRKLVTKRYIYGLIPGEASKHPPLRSELEEVA